MVHFSDTGDGEKKEKEKDIGKDITYDDMIIPASTPLANQDLI